MVRQARSYCSQVVRDFRTNRVYIYLLMSLNAKSESRGGIMDIRWSIVAMMLMIMHLIDDQNPK